MSNLDELRRRVEAAEERFRFINKVQKADGDRLLELVNRLKDELAKHRAENQHYRDEAERLSARNQELTGMLRSLLAAVETFGSGNTLQELEGRISTLLETSDDAWVGGEAADEAEPESVPMGVRAANESGPPSGGSADVDGGTDRESQDVSEIREIPSFFLREDKDGRDHLVVTRRSGRQS